MVGRVSLAPVAELVDALDSKSSSARSAGSIPARGTTLFLLGYLRLSPIRQASLLSFGKHQVITPSRLDDSNIDRTDSHYVSRKPYHHSLAGSRPNVLLFRFAGRYMGPDNHF